MKSYYLYNYQNLLNINFILYFLLIKIFIRKTILFYYFILKYFIKKKFKKDNIVFIKEFNNNI